MIFLKKVYHYFYSNNHSQRFILAVGQNVDMEKCLKHRFTVLLFIWLLTWSVDKLCSRVTRGEDHIGCVSHFIVACFNNCKNFNDTRLSWGLLLLYCPRPPASRGCTVCNVVEFIGAKMWFQDNPDCRYSSHLIQKIYSGFRFWFYSQKYFWYNLGQFLHFRYNLFTSNLHFYRRSVWRTIKRSIWFNSTY